MGFKETKGSKTVEAHVMPVPGSMFEEYNRIETKRGDHAIQQTIARGYGCPMPTAATASVLAEADAKRVIAL